MAVLTNYPKYSLAAGRWLLLPLILLALSAALQMRGSYAPINNWLLDFRMDRTPVAASGEVAVIAIDPPSLRDVGTWPWPRSVHGDLLDRLVELNAGVVFYDVDFQFPSSAEGDKAFAEALDRAGGATLLATFSQARLDGTIVHNLPHAPFYDRSWPAVVNVTPDNNGSIRSYPTGDTIDGVFVPSAGTQLAGAYASSGEGFVINYGLSPQSIPVFSASDLLNGTVTEADIAGRSILIGAAAAELGDHFAVPLYQVIPGVMIHALAAETLLQDAAISVASPAWVLGPLFALLCALQFVGRHNAWRLVSLGLLSSLGVELAALFAFWSGYTSYTTAMVHPAFVMLAIGRLAMSVDFSRLLIKRQNVQLENSERLRRHIFENSSDGFLAINRQGEVVFQSDIAKVLLGRDGLPDDVLATARQVLDSAEPKQRLDHLEIETPTGTKSLELRANPSELQSLDDEHNIASEPLTLITLRDVTELRQKQKRIAYLSQHDDRTTALRRHSFCDVIENRAKHGQTFSVAAVAVRRLTALNATLGREIGDQILSEAVARLTNSAAGLGEVARLEGNVLGVIIPDVTDDASLQQACQKIRDTLLQPYQLGGSQLQIGVSIGYVSVDPTQDCTGETYLSHAQDALAHSKDHSANTCIAYDSADSERRERSRRLEHALTQAMERNELQLLYQPQYRLSDRSLIGAETLLRWHSAEFGFVSPVEFIPIAESSGFITELGHCVLEHTIKSAVDLPENLVLSPNVSVFQLLSDDFPDQVSALLKRHGLSPDRLCLELTESEFLSPDSEAVAHMRAVKALGVSWALDDFGTGYSSLSYLKELPFEKIKLDRAFLKDVFTDPMAQTSLQSIVQLVQGYGKTLLCEGAETREDVELLTRLGCDSVQGYYFGRPETLEDFKSRVQAEASAARPALRAARLA